MENRGLKTINGVGIWRLRGHQSFRRRTDRTTQACPLIIPAFLHGILGKTNRLSMVNTSFFSEGPT